MIKAIITAKGVEYVEAQDIVQKWHMDQHKYRLILSIETQKKLIGRKIENEITGEYPDAEFLLSHFKQRQFATVRESGNVFIYLDNVLKEHVPFLDKNNIEIEQQPNV